MRLPLIISITALAVAVLGSTPLGRAAYDAVVPNNSVGTAQLKKDAVVSSKVKNGSLLRTDFGPGQIPEGPAGPAGPKGDPGTPATSMWAVVAGAGTPSVIASSPGIGVAKNTTGNYRVVFPQNVAQCAFAVTAQSSSNNPGAVTISSDPVGVIVSLRHSASNELIDGIFYIAVFC